MEQHANHRRSEAPPAKNRAPKIAADLGLPALAQPASSPGLSLDDLSQAFAAMLGQGSDPYVAPPEAPADPIVAAEADIAAQAAAVLDLPAELEPLPEEHCELSPRSILEAMLFVGTPAGQPLTSQYVAGLMRGVRPEEIDDLIRDLNEQYQANNCAYAVVSAGEGYRLALRPEMNALRDKVLGRSKSAKLSAAAVEVLSLVAYNEPLAADDVSRLRNTPSGHILSQLVRRQLLRLERTQAKPPKTQYFTTRRFLELFGLASLEELPRSQEIER